MTGKSLASLRRVAALFLSAAALFFSTEPVFGDDTPTGAAWLGPCDLLLDRGGEFLYVLEEESQNLRRLRTDGSAPAEIVSLPVRPRRMTFFPDESRIAIAGGGPDGKALVVKIAEPTSDVMKPVPMTLEKEFSVGHTPSDIAVGPRGSGEVVVYVSNQFSGTVSAIAFPDGAFLRDYPVGREPFAMKITPDGKFLVVSGLTAEFRADVAYTMACVRVVDLEKEEVHQIELLNGVTNLKDIALSPDGNFAFITGTIGNYQTVTSQVVGGWIVENIFSIVDIPNHQLVDTVYLDDALRGAANPWGIDVSDDGQFLVLAISGTNEVLFMPYDRVMEIITSRPSPNRPGFGSYTYFYRSKGEVRLPIRIRVTLGVPGMRRILIRGDSVWVAGLFEDVIGRVTITLNPPYEFYPDDDFHYPTAPKPLRQEEDVIDLPENAPLKFVELEPFSPLKGVEIKREIARLGSKPILTTVRRGEILFHNALPCMEHWQSCITCHPDARVDGLNWDLLNDGVGNPKNTKSLLLSHETPPSMITGIRADAETAVRAGVTHILFGKLPEEDYCAIDDYLQALRPVPSPKLVKGELSESAKRGKFLFESPRTNCSTCHPAPYFTDLALHNTGSQSYNESLTRFDTPTLIEVWRTAPYMNNGHWLTIRELLTEGKHGNKEGLLDQLTDQELDDLIEYVLSL